MTRPSLAQYAATREELLWRAGDLFNWIKSGELKLRIEKTFRCATPPRRTGNLKAGRQPAKFYFFLEALRGALAMTIPILLFSLILYVFPFQSAFAVIGSVRDTNGQRVTSIRVSLLDENYHSIRTVFVDSSGRFQFRGLRQGVYLVRVEPVGTPYEEQVQRVEFQSISGRGGGAEEPYMLDFTLKRKKSESPVREIVFTQTIPDAARVEFERGAGYLSDGKFEQAGAALKKAIEIFPITSRPLSCSH